MTVLIQRLGLMGKLANLLNFERVTASKELAQRLNDDREVQAVLGKANIPSIRASDVVEAKEFLEAETKRTVDRQLATGIDSKKLVAQAHEKTAQLLSDLDRVGKLFDTLLTDLPTLRERAMSFETDKKGQLVHAYPVKGLKALLDVIQTGVKVVEAVKADKTIQQFKNEGTIINGMPLDEVFATIFAVGKELGATEDQITIAFSRVRQKGQVLDAQFRVQS